MKASDEAMMHLCESLAQEIGAGADFELDMGELIGKYRRRFSRAMAEQEAAKLLPLGAEIAAERQHCHRATVYRRAMRAIRARKIVAPLIPRATIEK